MKLHNIIETIKTISKNQPNVNTVFVGDIYDLNTQKAIEYSVMVITEQTHTVNNNDGYEVWGISLFYVDRQTSDNSNILDVHSHAIEVLNSVVNELDEIGVIIENNYTVNTFNERFAALCSGAYVTLNLRVPFATCDKYELVRSVNGMRGDVIINTNRPISQIEEGNTKDSVNSVAVIDYIDNKGFVTEGELTPITEDITELSGTTTSLNNTITTSINPQLVNLDGRVTTVEGVAVSLGNRLGTLENGLTTVSGRVSTLSGEVTTVSGRVSTLSGEVTTVSGRVSTLSGEVTTVSGRVNTISGEVTTVSGSVNSLSGEVNTLKSSKQNTLQYYSEDTTNKDVFIEPQRTVTVNTDTFLYNGFEVATKGDLETITDRVTTVEGNITTLGNRVSSAETKEAQLQAEIDRYKELLLLVNAKCVYTDFSNVKHAASANMAAVINTVKEAKIIHITGNMDGVIDAAHWFEGTDARVTPCEQIEEFDASQIQYFYATFNKSKVLLPQHLNCYQNKTFVGCFDGYKAARFPNIIECGNLQIVNASNYTPMYNNGYRGDIDPWRYCFSNNNVFTNLPTFNGLRYSPSVGNGRFNQVTTIVPTTEEWKSFCEGLGTPISGYNNFTFNGTVWSRIKALSNFAQYKQVAVAKGWVFND